MKLPFPTKIYIFFCLITAFLAIPALADEETRPSTGPTIRALLSQTKKPVTIATTLSYTVYAGGEAKGSLPSQGTAELSYQKGVYTFKSANQNFSGEEFIRLVPDVPGSYLTITSLDRRLKGRKINFNKYQGIIEYRFSTKNKIPYIINELPLEEYVAGLGEAGNNDPTEYLKALVVAARTYAYMNIASTTQRHLFDVYSSTNDQLYLGYNAVLYAPNIVKAAEATVGEMVAFAGKPVVTYYFGHSNGKTTGDKSGTRPWLQGVLAPYDKGKKMWGHGLGMSCNDAFMHAKKEKWTYDQILRYYYTSTQVEKVY